MRTVHFLGTVLAVQLALGVGLVVWATQGFPLPGFLTADEPVAARPAAARPAVALGVDRFDGPRAFALLREQVRRFGPRPAGSDASRRLALRLRALLPRGRFEAVPGGLRNVVGVVPGRRPAVLVGAHYDTEAVIRGHLGANDGAAGTAAVVELAHHFARARRRADAPELRFVLFDGEEEPAGSEDLLADGLRGSRAYARRHARDLRAVVVLDYIAEARGLRFPREEGSDLVLWERLRAAARRVGTGRLFPPATSGEIIDDHTPFTERGVPAIDLIDFDYPQRDSRRDDLDAVSVGSLDAVGETVAAFVDSW